MSAAHDAPIVFEHSYARLPDHFYARVQPEPVPRPRLIKVNHALAAELGLDPAWLESEAGVAMLSGNALPASAEPIAMAYAGHQFGGWSPQLGDGRAMLLGEIVARDGVRRDVQLKGAGRTPFSRQGDGKAPLGPVLREYLVSEAMAALGIPTTRALAAVATGETLYREGAVPGGVLTRVARSHVRVGTFQYFAASGRVDAVRALADYVIDRHEPEAKEADRPYVALLEAIVRRQALLIASWMQVGFIHGVMNTDNMQVAGETIDFGPCAFMEAFDAQTVLSSIDHRGRYAWGNQPPIGQWNLTRLAEALLPLLDPEESVAIERAQAAIESYVALFNAHFTGGFCEKLGLPVDRAGAQTFIEETFDLLTREHVDFTLFFRHLTRIAHGEDTSDWLALFDNPRAGERWLALWRARIGSPSGEATDPGARMRRVNPIFVPRNHQVEAAIQAAQAGDDSVFERLNAVWARPYDEQPEHADLEAPATDRERVTRTFCGT